MKYFGVETPVYKIPLDPRDKSHGNSFRMYTKIKIVFNHLKGAQHPQIFTMINEKIRIINRRLSALCVPVLSLFL